MSVNRTNVFIVHTNQFMTHLNNMADEVTQAQAVNTQSVLRDINSSTKKHKLISWALYIFLSAKHPSGPGPPHSRGF